VVWTPLHGLNLSAGGSYIHSEIEDNFTNYNPNGIVQDFNGEPFPNTPKWQAVADADYHWGLGGRLDGFLGGDVTFQDTTNAELGELPILKVPAYTLLGLRAGVETKDGAWRLMFWGRNVTNTFYLTSANRDLDTTTRFAGMPATYGVTLTWRYK
jgi:iron complex outermembrane recepter protein